MKETPNGAEIPSHIFMLRAGMISQVMAGAYAYLPLGWRSLYKAINIVRDEMNKAGAVHFKTLLYPVHICFSYRKQSNLHFCSSSLFANI